MGDMNMDDVLAKLREASMPPKNTTKGRLRCACVLRPCFFESESQCLRNRA